MKKVLLFVVVVAVGAFVAYQLFDNKDETPAGEEPKGLTVGKQSGDFRQSLDTLMAAYFSLKDALVKSDTVSANNAAMQLAVAADSLNAEGIEGDSTGVIKETAKNFAGTIQGSAHALSLEQGLNEKRLEFEMISDALWSLARTVKYQGSKVYYQFCPMAFDNRGAYWISQNSEIRNPYFGDKMLTCGSNRDSISYNN